MTSAAISLLVVALLSSSLLAPHLIPAAYARHVVVVVKASEGLKNIGGLRVLPPAAANTAGSSRPVKTVEMRAASAEEQQHRDAAAEMHGMLARDYAGQRPGGVAASRRRPIHNSEPLQDDEP